MQQTEIYKLNKPETTDPFTPAPLNENADKLEGALTALDGRVTTLEAHKIAAGWFVGNGDTQTIQLGFTPIVVFLCHQSAGLEYAMAVTGKNASPHPGASASPLGITEGGFWVKYSNVLNQGHTDYFYLAIA